MILDKETHVQPINTAKPINTQDLLYIDKYGHEWLRSGFVETDFISYPKAKVMPLNVIDWIGDTVSPTINPEGLAVDDNYIYVNNFSTSTVYLIDKTDPYTLQDSFSTPTDGLDVDDNFIYSSQGSDVYIYDKLTPFGQQGTFNVSAYTSEAFALCVDDNYIYVGGASEAEIFLFDKVTYVYHSSISIPEVAAVEGLFIDDSYIYIVDSTTNSLYIYIKDTHVLLSIKVLGGVRLGITIDDNLLYLVDQTDDTINFYNKQDSIGISEYKDNNGIPIYIRIK